MSLGPGSRLGPYRLVEKVGEGGMGVVWKARDTALDRDVAIKLLPEPFARDPERLARFEREAKAVAALAHPGIVAIFGFGEQDGIAYAVTEMLEGRTVRDELAAGPLAPKRAAEIARGVAEALAVAHERGIVHRDLKPENLFLTRDGRTKILDFGLAAFAAASPSGASPNASEIPTKTSLTTPGTVLGTVDYLSPEQIRGAATDPRSDIFSLGSVLFELLSGRRPFQRPTAAETMTAILREEPPDAALYPAAVPPRLAQVVRRCLEKTPRNRFGSARELVAAIDDATGPGAAAGAPRTTAAMSRSARWWRVGAALLAVLLLLLGYRVLRGRGLFGGPSGGSAPTPLSLTSIGEPRSAVPEANEYLEKGIFYMRARLDIPQAQKMLERAIALDPRFGTARALYGLTFLITVHEGFSNDASLIYRGERESRDALAAHPDLASAHATLGAALLYLNRKEQARRELETVLRIDPTSQSAEAWLAIADYLDGEYERAAAGSRKLLDAVPLFYPSRVLLADVLLETGRPAEARLELDKVFEQDPRNLTALRSSVRLRLYEGDLAGARGLLESVSAATHPNFKVRILWALLLAREGHADQAIAALDGEVLKYAGIGLFVPALVADVYALAGRPDQALDWLDRAVRSGDSRAAWFRRDAFLAGIRQQRRFQSILEAIDYGKR